MMIGPAMTWGSAEAGLVTGWPGTYPWAASVPVSALVCCALSGPATANSKAAANSRIRPPEERRVISAMLGHRQKLTAGQGRRRLSQLTVSIYAGASPDFGADITVTTSG